jgi:hypothetical protein
MSDFTIFLLISALGGGVLPTLITWRLWRSGKIGWVRFAYFVGTYWAGLIGLWLLRAPIPLKTHWYLLIMTVPCWICAWLPGGLIGLVIGRALRMPQTKMLGCGTTHEAVTCEQTTALSVDGTEKPTLTKARWLQWLLVPVINDPDLQVVANMVMIGSVPWIIALGVFLFPEKRGGL